MTRSTISILIFLFLSISCLAQIPMEEGGPEVHRKYALSIFETIIHWGNYDLDKHNKMYLQVADPFIDEMRYFNDTIDLKPYKKPLFNTAAFKRYICDTLFPGIRTCEPYIDQLPNMALADLQVLGEYQVTSVSKSLKAKLESGSKSLTEVDLAFNDSGLLIHRRTSFVINDITQLFSKTGYIYEHSRLVYKVDTIYKQPYLNNPQKIQSIDERYFSDRSQLVKVVSKSFNYVGGQEIVSISKREIKYDSQQRVTYYENKTNNSGEVWSIEYDRDEIRVQTFYSDIKGTAFRYRLAQ